MENKKLTKEEQLQALKVQVYDLSGEMSHLTNLFKQKQDQVNLINKQIQELTLELKSQEQ